MSASNSKAFKTELREYLLADTALAALIDNRIYATQGAQHPATPYLVYFTVSANETRAHDGPTGNEEYRIQIDIYALTAALCDEIRDLVKTRLNGLKTSFTTVRVQKCFFDNEFEDYDDTAKLKQKSIDFLFTVSAIP